MYGAHRTVSRVKMTISYSHQKALISVQELLEEGAVEQFHRRLMELNMDSAEELQSYIHKLSLSVEQHRLARAEVCGSVCVAV